ncbi:CGNR zinc finger domain-containing protein [Shouchella miscanthi]|uniref:CGNR zinc finger domain-containing protein n=1 Tax=Shouchella miscanthi TaxID=2598861 RepID=A0ABU6NQG4_9BACI|nr:CGNR zinc finger domain-containing protein [Shouchella miscanthi]MED4129450.1 CGNR zinc finger domain-containing protein [Shouchella miscanthi]
MQKLLFSLGGAPWMNLINTVYTSDKQTVDTLDDVDATREWLIENALLRTHDSFQHQTNAEDDFLIQHLTSLRTLCTTILTDLLEKGSLSSSSKKLMKEYVKDVQLDLSLGEKISLLYEGTTLPHHLTYKIVESILSTVDKVAPTRIRNCEHHDCQLYFIDTSKSGKRRWCSMELCGNRQKAAEFYARKKK